MVSEMVAMAVCGVGVLESVTVTPKVNVPAVAGGALVLYTWPGGTFPTVVVDMEKPVGSVPLVTATV